MHNTLGRTKNDAQRDAAASHKGDSHASSQAAHLRRIDCRSDPGPRSHVFISQSAERQRQTHKSQMVVSCVHRPLGINARLMPRHARRQLQLIDGPEVCKSSNRTHVKSIGRIRVLHRGRRHAPTGNASMAPYVLGLLWHTTETQRVRHIIGLLDPGLGARRQLPIWRTRRGTSQRDA